MSEIRPDYCIALRMIALQEYHREAQGWLSEHLEGDDMMRAVAVSDYNALLDRCISLRAENEKLRAASGSLVRSLSGCWYAFEPSLRREMGNTNYHCVKEKMDEVEALLDLRAAATALKETGDD